VEPPPPTAKQKREWRAEFKRLGREARHGRTTESAWRRVQNAGDWEYCYWKQKRDGRWKLKCDD
jgi:hypothetical protein